MPADIFPTNGETAALDGRRGLLDFIDGQSNDAHHVLFCAQQINPH